MILRSHSARLGQKWLSAIPNVSARNLSSSPRQSAKQSTEAAKADRKARLLLRKSDPEAMTLSDAATVLKAIDVAQPTSAYELTVLTHFVKGQAPPRGRISLPRDPRTKAETMLVFAEGKQAQAATRLGAAYVGGVELIEDVLQGKIVPTKVLCTPALLPKITPRLARFLGPKGLMPAARRGTVTDDITGAVKAATGTLDWKGDKQGVVRVPIGRLTYPVPDLERNIRAFLKNIQDVTADKDTLFQQKKKSTLPTVLRVYLSSRQGPGIPLMEL